MTNEPFFGKCQRCDWCPRISADYNRSVAYGIECKWCYQSRIMRETREHANPKGIKRERVPFQGKAK